MKCLKCNRFIELGEAYVNVKINGIHGDGKAIHLNCLYEAIANTKEVEDRVISILNEIKKEEK